MPYAELLSRTCYSLLDGASQPHELVAAAARAGVAHVGVEDRDGVYGLVQADTAAKEHGVHLVCGASLTVAVQAGVTVAVQAGVAGAAQAGVPGAGHPGTPVSGHAGVSVLVADLRGWSSLCRLLTIGRGRCAKGRSEVTAEELGAHADGLIAVLRPGWTAEEAEPLRQAFGDRLYVALSRDLTTADRPRIAAALALGRALDRPVVATNDVRMHAPERRIVADVLACIRRKTTLKQAGRALAGNAERYLLSEAAFRERYRDWPEAIAAASEAAERCSFRLAELRYGYPRELVPEGHTPMSWLREVTETGLRWRYPSGVPPKVRAAVDHEFAVIEELDFPSYFLTVHDVVRFARSQGILCQGRGSAANSAICYALGVTSVDPTRAELLFERFISKERGEPPDIDVDFEHERREEVIQYIYARYGRDRAGMVNEFISYRQRSAVREVGKVFGLSLDQVDRLAKSLDRWSAGLESPRAEDVATGRAQQKWSQPREGGHAAVFVPPAEEVAELVREAGLDPESDEVRGTLQAAAELAGFPRHLSIHVGGFVISAGSLGDLVPIEPATMEGRTVLQWDKYDVEALDFVKVDVLALGMLTAIRKAFDLVEEHGGPELSLATVPAEDPAVYDMFCKADTVGVFQIESRAQMSMLPRLKPRCFYDLVIEVAIVRPGPIQGGMVHPYLRRRLGEEPVEYAHPALVPILERTLGVPLFQEQVMAIAIAVGGFTPGDADRLRRAMGAWRKRGNLQEMGRRLVEGMVERGIDRQYAEAVYAQVLGFGEYGFPESHAASFALLVYVSGWIKLHHPAAFAAALINSQPMGFYSPRALLADAQRHGVEVRPVSVAHSSYDCTLEPGEPLDPGWPGGGRAGPDRGSRAPGPGALDRGAPGALDRGGPGSQDRDPVALAHRPDQGGPGALDLDPGALDRGAPSALDPEWARGGGPVSAEPERLAIRCGLRLVRGIGEEHAAAILAAREERPFRSLADFAARTGLDRGRLQTLAEAGAFEALAGPDRRKTAWQLQGLWTDLPLLAGLSRREPDPPLPPQDPLDRLQADYRSTGLSVDLHPIQFVRAALDEMGCLRLAELAGIESGAAVRIGGLVSTRQRPGTSNGVVFLTLEDETGLANLVVWPKTWAANRKLARTATMLGVDGRLQRQDDAVSVLVDRFWPLPEPDRAESSSGPADRIASPDPTDAAAPGIPRDRDPGSRRVKLGDLPVRSRDFH